MRKIRVPTVCNLGSNVRFDASSKSYGCLNKKKLKNLCKKSTLRIFSEVLQYKNQDINVIRASNERFHKSCRIFPGSVWNRTGPHMYQIIRLLRQVALLERPRLCSCGDNSSSSGSSEQRRFGTRDGVCVRGRRVAPQQQTVRRAIDRRRSVRVSSKSRRVRFGTAATRKIREKAYWLCKKAPECRARTITISGPDNLALKKEIKIKFDKSNFNFNIQNKKTAAKTLARSFLHKSPQRKSGAGETSKSKPVHHLRGINIFSVYAPPRPTDGEFAALLSDIADEAQSKRPLVVAGDFNVWSMEWGSDRTTQQGMAPLDALAPLDVVLFNTGDRPTFVVPDREMAPSVSLGMLCRVCRKVKEHTALGPDGVPNAVLKIAGATCPDIFLQVFTACMRSEVFPGCWKRQRLVLLPKTGKPPNEPTSFRPICMLDVVGKMLERFICDHLQVFTESPSGLSDRQFGFRRGRSTIDVIVTVVSMAREALRGRRWLGGTKEYCTVVMLDVKNAFNTARWKNILTALESIEMPAYLLKIISNYFQDRVLEYSTSDGPEAGSVTAGVPQGSVLGLTLWNVMYDSMLRLNLQRSVNIVGFADAIALVTVAKHLRQIENHLNALVAQTAIRRAPSKGQRESDGRGWSSGKNHAKDRLTQEQLKEAVPECGQLRPALRGPHLEQCYRDAGLLAPGGVNLPTSVPAHHQWTPASVAQGHLRPSQHTTTGTTRGRAN
ncbi:unnamed protein product [Trichogramma brassicae]|uniref:Reverse transcriptase domain-containing protein n=1 Tax=Trichogramma brassicae TaxID=86971 RepID=A0A6H5IFU4_9HYME|nr:unnamed protein product [Trichogramma brassicae]